MEIEKLKKRAEEQFSAHKEEIEQIGEFVFEHPEPGMEEYESAAYLENVLERNGFEVKGNYVLPTAFRAAWGTGKPVIAFLPEYDALPGYGENNNEMAHACGHNWISATTLGAAIVLSNILKEDEATILVIGTPAEETTGGKCDLVKAKAFEGIDAVFQMHLGPKNLLAPKTQAMDSIEFEFFGKASHAAAAPEQGISALDAVLLVFSGLNAKRTYLRKSASVMGIITNGGQACNIVPEYAACRFYVRDETREKVKELVAMMIDIAKGAELMTGAKMKYRFFENSFDDLNNDEHLVGLMEANLRKLGIDRFDEQKELGGSSDIGNVSKAARTMYFEMNTGANPPVYAHENEFLEWVHGKKAEATIRNAVLGMAWSALDVIKEAKDQPEEDRD
ncbi:M20 family metallopeptidase [uncultured Dubosiella sp.]|uniref:M20 family metallopeptidase n=1 Tax=uncultured Dubosiella sp. TaxID=1937011 RepID=UPI0025E1585F|nr:M20 family metallopeptidase [uncultured Dubosiella sp.]